MSAHCPFSLDITDLIKFHVYFMIKYTFVAENQCLSL